MRRRNFDRVDFQFCSEKLTRAEAARVKQSGVDREGGEEALRFFSDPKDVCIAK
jgi:acyl-CoA reductase-like NAD-dependent aldehyde dehydrogenase